jgi:NTE family protein
VPVTPTLREWLREAPFALGMSSGFFGFFAHAGVVSVLEDEGLAPVKSAGSSAGALVSGLWSAGVDAVRLRDELLGLRREHFWDPAPGLGLLRGQLFYERVRGLVGARRLEAGRFPAAVSAFDVWRRETRVLAQGEVASALVASCAVPLLFHPAWIDGRPYLDGGVLDRPGLAGLSDEPRVFYHHLAARSPWRRRASPALRIPERTGLTALVIDGLPRLGPFRLREAPRAFSRAADAMRIALGSRLHGDQVRVTT